MRTREITPGSGPEVTGRIQGGYEMRGRGARWVSKTNWPIDQHLAGSILPGRALVWSQFLSKFAIFFIIFPENLTFDIFGSVVCAYLCPETWQHCLQGSQPNRENYLWKTCQWGVVSRWTQKWNHGWIWTKPT